MRPVKLISIVQQQMKVYTEYWEPNDDLSISEAC